MNPIHVDVTTASLWIAENLAEFGYYMSAGGILRNRWGQRMTDADVLRIYVGAHL